jgi:hypothetical protein
MTFGTKSSGTCSTWRRSPTRYPISSSNVLIIITLRIALYGMSDACASIRMVKGSGQRRSAQWDRMTDAGTYSGSNVQNFLNFTDELSKNRCPEHRFLHVTA